MRGLLIFITIFTSTICFCQESKLIEIRTCFKKIESVHDIEKLINMTKANLDHPVFLAYNFTSKLMLLDYFSNPFKQYRIFKTKTTQIDSIVRANPKNIEIRLLRYMVQKNCPYFLSYKANIESDARFIKSHLNKENDSLQFYIETLLNQFDNERSGNPS